ncbi:rhodanese-like domain-containing protein [Acetobacterium carbinolicum]|jgi:rhodanese-related sulfurtransferase|uniref:rhodanese-like domain-containing protein n=1 Tax=Acetobacterium TaxID=33951 RepID=UPI000DBECE0A|nr:rhodanese-like domain-containing protein [Acetobacterium sp. KB-1]AWW27788.1 rhodanese-like domain-containing protein [Acetobacterium sp. KB-1]
MLNLLSRKSESKNSVKRISPAEAKKRLDANEPIVLLDVREKNEYAGQHIPNSINLPLGQIQTVDKIVPDKNATIFVYCLSGGRSQSAASQMVKMGYQNIYNLGGIGGWKYGTVSSH